MRPVDVYSRARSIRRLGRAGALLLLLVGPLAAPASAANGSTIVPRLSLITEPNAGMGPIFRLLSSPRRSLDLTMYELNDPRAEAILISDAARGVRVRVLLDKRDEESANAAGFADLAQHGVAVRWTSSRFALTHEKAVVLDGETALVMTLNLVARDYATTRDFAVLDSQARDVAAIERVFSEDWANTSGSMPAGDDLVWSPGAEASLVQLINSATSSLLVENEEMSDSYIIRPLEAAARRGVDVEVVMTRSPSWSDAFDALTKAGVHVRTYSPYASLYVHAKVVVSDSIGPHGRAFVGSQNFSIQSLLYNRELGLITPNRMIVHDLAATLASDFAGAARWST